VCIYCAIMSGKSAATITGTSGNDILASTGDYDSIFSLGGDDTIHLNHFQVSVTPGSGSNSVFFADDGSTSNSHANFHYEEFTSKITVSVTQSEVTVDKGSDGTDAITGFSPNNPASLSLNLGSGDDVVTADYDGDVGLLSLTASGGDGNDFMVGGDGIDMLVGDAGNDTIYAGANDSGLDRLDGGDGDDVLGGGSGKDFVTGGDGEDVLFGASGDDYMSGGLGSDQVFGGAGDDTVRGGEGDASDTLYGGEGDDYYYFDADFGDDFIGGFDAIDSDKIDLFQLGLSGFEDLTITQSDTDTVVDTGQGTITLWNVAASDITEDDFFL